MPLVGYIPEGWKGVIISLIPFIVYILKLIIDNWGITELEKLRLSNFKKFQIAITKYAVISLAFVFTLYLFIKFSDNFTEIEDNNAIIIGLIICFSFFLLSIFLAEQIIRFISLTLSFQYDYHIVNDKGEPIFRILKLSSNNLLLVERDEIVEFIDARENRRYKRIRRDNKLLKKIYNYTHIRYIIIGLCVLSLFGGIGALLTEAWIQFVLYIIFIFTMMINIIFIFNYLENKRFNRELRNE